MTPAKVNMSDLNETMKVALVEETLRRVLPHHIGVSVNPYKTLTPHVLLVAQVACGFGFTQGEWDQLSPELIEAKAKTAIESMRAIDCTKPPRGDKT